MQTYHDSVGLAFSVRPAWGQTASGVQRLWETGITGALTPSGEANGRLDARVSYGMAMFGGHVRGTPEFGLGLSEVGEEWRMGWKFGLIESKRVACDLGFDMTRWEPATGAAPKNRFGVNATVLW